MRTRLLEEETLFLLCPSPREHGDSGSSWARIIRGSGKSRKWCCVWLGAGGMWFES